MARASATIALDYESAHILSQALAARMAQVTDSARLAPIHKRETIATLRALSAQCDDALTAMGVQLRQGASE